MAKVKLHTHQFKITNIGPITNSTGKDGKACTRRVLQLLDVLKLNEAEKYRIPHDVLFSNLGIKHTQSLSVGDYVELEYSISASLSKSKISHTHIVPLKITKIQKP